MNEPLHSPRTVWLLGRGRTGTTWIARGLSQYPNCHFRHEPFLRDKIPAYQEWLQNVALETLSAAKLEREFRQLASGCFHQADFPPFIRKSCRAQSPLLLRIFWQLGKYSPPLRWIYERYGTPRYDERSVLFIKDVNFPNELLPQAFGIIKPQILAVIRNPYASVDSARRFLKPGTQFRSTATIDRVRMLMSYPGHEHLRQFLPELDTMTEVEFEALRWRVQTEPLYNFVSQCGSGRVFIYERLCANPEREFDEMLEFLGWSEKSQVLDFCRSSSRESRRWGWAARRKEHGIRKDSKANAEKWKERLAPAEIESIHRIVHDSSLLCFWPELL